MHIVSRYFFAVLVCLLGIQGVALAEGKCGIFTSVVVTDKCAAGNPGVSLSLGKLDEAEVVADLYIKIANNSERPVSFGFGADVLNLSWVFVQEKDGSFASITGLQVVMAGGNARGVSVQPGQTVWYQIRLQGWETFKPGEIKKIFVGFSVVGPDEDTLKKVTIFPFYIGRTYELK